MRRWLPVFAVIVVAGFLTGSKISAWDGSVRVDGYPSDALYDWLVVRAVVGDGDPYDSVETLTELHRIDASMVSPTPHPRTPGALLLQTPLLLVDADSARPLMGAMILVSMCLVAWAVAKLTGWPPWVGGLLVVFAMVTTPMVSALFYGSQGPAVAALVAVAWVMLRHGNQRTGGVLLGVAVMLKAFPALLVVLLVWSYRKASTWAVMTGAVLTGAGLLLPDVSVAGAVAGFRAVSDHYSTSSFNLAAGFPLWVVVVVSAGLVVWARRQPLDSVMVVGSAGMLALSPVLWYHYLPAVLAPVALTVERVRSLLGGGTGERKRRIPDPQVVESGGVATRVL